ncbi:MAG: Protease [Firmicutes bacterium]|nr:Protease [Bacillota bacterium]MDI6706711.1 DUF3656 domain-containing protein [Bacillota bacterium]
MAYMPELLSPAGSMEAFVAAIQNGADAVYLGGKRFNARQYASNFDDEGLRAAIDYAHVRGKRVYVTLNILLTNREFEEALEYAAFLYNIGADAIIVQDMGAASLISRAFPGIRVHASTQMTIYDLNGVKMLEDMGISRVVLARELTAGEIARISRRSNVELEVFVQGALCMCYSGQCLMSSVIGGRSGNRGRCAQPCRLRYSLVDRGNLKRVYREGYLLSPKDLFTLENIGRLMDARIRSFKIEGRMKRPEYVAAVTSVYRRAIDEYSRSGRITGVEEGRRKIGKVFYRGFTEGYMFDVCTEEMLSIDRPDSRGFPLGRVVGQDGKNGTVEVRLEDSLNVGDGIEVETGGKSSGTRVSAIMVNGENRDKGAPGEIVALAFSGRLKKGDRVYKTFDRELMESLTASYAGENVKVPVNLAVRLRIGEPAEIYVWDEDGNSESIKGRKLVEEAVNLPLGKARIEEQLSRTGGTPYTVTGIQVDMDRGAYIPVSELNALRREALNRLGRKRTSAGRGDRCVDAQRNMAELNNKCVKAPGSGIPYLAVETGDVSLLDDLKDIGVDRIYLRYSPELIEELGSIGRMENVFVKLPTVTREKDAEGILGLLNECKDFVEGIEVSNPGQIVMCKKHAGGIRIHGGDALNIFNSVTIGQLLEWGCASMTLSPELNFAQIKDLTRGCGSLCEIIIHGRLRLMTIEYPLLKGLEKGIPYGLKDRKNMVFPLGLDGTGRVEILNSQPVFMLDKTGDIVNSGAGGTRMVHTVENPGTFLRLIKNYKDALRGGEYDRDLAADMVEGGMTRGHFYRGVE